MSLLIPQATIGTTEEYSLAHKLLITFCNSTNSTRSIRHDYQLRCTGIDCVRCMFCIKPMGVLISNATAADRLETILLDM